MNKANIIYTTASLRILNMNNSVWLNVVANGAAVDKKRGAVASGLLSFCMLLTFVLSVKAQSLVKERVSKRPNILFCIADDASWEHMAAYGLTDWVRTPGFDQVAKEGLLFMNVYTPNAKCSPSRAAILTGRNPWQLDEAGNHNPFFPAQYTTVVESLASNGYKVGFTGKGWGPGNPGKINGVVRQLTGPGYNKIKTQAPTRAIFTTDYTANFEAFLKERKEDEPFFFWYGGFEPHRLYEYGSGVAKGGKKLSDIDKVPEYWIDNEPVRNDMLDYGYEVEYFDSHLLRMIQLLEQRGELENTIIVVTSDNGMPFPRVKGHVYEAANHLPFALMWKEHVWNPGRKVEDFISFIDLAPTFLELAGVTTRTSSMQPLEGRSFTDILSSKQNKRLIDPRRDHVLLGRERTDPGRPHNQGYPVRGIVKNGYIYTRNYAPDRWPSGNPETGFLDIDNGPTKTELLKAHEAGTHPKQWALSFDKRPAEELYHLKTDTFCMANLATDKKFAAVLSQMRKQMEEELTRQRDPRMMGNGDVFDAYPFAKPEAQDYYERYMKGELKKQEADNN